ncbi:NAD(P)/FAD-dependent oxidoreductase [Arthrobacter sp. 2MCAF15]|uniref:NAD(P)/FAD-dependent oxidoreductase n=1 Tax=Arthrobacter sp. 2MCAF15 TaxID=3232984 RepID=UPI003F9025B7
MNKVVVVIGAGSLGLGTGCALVRQPGVEVVVLDKKHPAAGSSGVSVGVFTRLYNDEFEIGLRVRTVQLLEDLEAEQGLKLRRIGMLRLARDAQGLAVLEESCRVQEQLGVKGTRMVAPEHLEEILPIDATGIVGAIYNGQDGYLDGTELCTAMTGQIRAAGGQVRANAEVVRVERGGVREFEVLLADGSRIEADAVVNAAGSWAGEVGELLNAPISMINERHEAYVFQLPRDYQGPVLPMTMDYVVGAEEPGVYFRHEGKDQLIAGMHSNSILGELAADPDSVRQSVSEDHVELIMHRLAELLPGIDLGYRGGWAGIYPHARSQNFMIGEYPAAPNVYVAAGGGGVGVNMGPVLGEVLAEQIVHGKSLRFVTPQSWLPA